MNTTNRVIRHLHKNETRVNVTRTVTEEWTVFLDELSYTYTCTESPDELKRLLNRDCEFIEDGNKAIILFRGNVLGYAIKSDSADNKAKYT